MTWFISSKVKTRWRFVWCYKNKLPTIIATFATEKARQTSDAEGENGNLCGGNPKSVTVLHMQYDGVRAKTIPDGVSVNLSPRIPHEHGSRCKGNQVCLLSLSSCIQQQFYAASPNSLRDFKVQSKTYISHYHIYS